MTDAPDDLAKVLHDLGRAIKLITAKRPEYNKRRQFYEGTRAEVWANDEVAKQLEASSAAHPIALAHIPVDALMDKVNLSNLKADGSGTAVLETAWNDSNLDDEIDDWNRHAGYLGDYYVIIDPDDTADDGTTSGETVVGSSPLTTVMVYSPKDSRTAQYGAKVWAVNEDDNDKRVWYATMFYDDMTLSLVTAEGAGETADASSFAPDLDDSEDADPDGDSWMQPHEGGLPLLVHLRVDGQPYGRPIHGKAFGPQDAITKISATNLSTVDAQGFPTRYALLDPMAEIDDDLDDDFGTDGPEINVTPDGQTRATGPRSRLKLKPGTINILRGVSKVGQFDAAETDTFLKNLDWYVRVMAVATGTPLFEFDLDGEQPSGEARRRAEGRINKHAAKVIRSLAAGYRKLGDTLLGIHGVEAVVTAIFQPVESSTDKDGLELVALKVLNGVPLRIALVEAGYTDEQVDEWWPEPDKGETAPASINMVTAIAEAMAKLGTAKTLGIINDAELVDLIPMFLTGARNEGGEPVDDAELGTKPAPVPFGIIPPGGAQNPPAPMPPGIPPIGGPGPTPPPAPPKGLTPPALAPFAASTAAKGARVKAKA